MASLATDTGDDNKLPEQADSWFDIELGKPCLSKTGHFMLKNGLVYDMNFVKLGEYLENIFSKPELNGYHKFEYNKHQLKYAKITGYVFKYYIKNKSIPPGLPAEMMRWKKPNAEQLALRFKMFFNVDLNKIKVGKETKKEKKTKYETNQDAMIYLYKNKGRLPKHSSEQTLYDWLNYLAEKQNEEYERLCKDFEIATGEDFNNLRQENKDGVLWIPSPAYKRHWNFCLGYGGAKPKRDDNPTFYKWMNEQKKYNTDNYKKFCQHFKIRFKKDFETVWTQRSPQKKQSDEIIDLTKRLEISDNPKNDLLQTQEELKMKREKAEKEISRLKQELLKIKEQESYVKKMIAKRS